MKYFYDTEFIEDGTIIDLVSIGVVCEDGREFYAISTEFDETRANPWVKKHVLPQLPPRSNPAWMDRTTLKAQLFEFLVPHHVEGRRLHANERPELWAWVGAYDHVALAQLWGDMTGLPQELPRFTRELKQLWEMAGSPTLPEPPTNAHDALADARFNVVKYRACMESWRRKKG
ncbi:polyadenylate-specific 3'-exoribonuclease AS [Corynebacterium sp. zg254]|uniref:3'-5' exoribonuclease n=1 Tax=Corynebacterium zhongnanshanii TaxID=2768834 RepID=A0ABQ6VD61_9CORY|nr:MULTISPECIES: polyadenylate-specific 3'-exoribonuclease AS [Corynebacterium]KAB3520834.1 polyadenylate-specific 3'-exoribonuclease AS [Corynebacterium zhongnanshanii]MCR5914454.1 polyadenylate-specific 3'-exoribonuclease AS [Corynebacterium sp. zg254]